MAGCRLPAVQRDSVEAVEGWCGGLASCCWHPAVAPVTAIRCKQRPSIRPPLPIFSSACSFPGLEKKAKARPAGTLYRLLTVADPVLDPVRHLARLGVLDLCVGTVHATLWPVHLNRTSAAAS